MNQKISFEETEYLVKKQDVEELHTANKFTYKHLKNRKKKKL